MGIDWYHIVSKNMCWKLIHSKLLKITGTTCYGYAYAYAIFPRVAYESNLKMHKHIENTIYTYTFTYVENKKKTHVCK